PWTTFSGFSCSWFRRQRTGLLRRKPNPEPKPMKSPALLLTLLLIPSLCFALNPPPDEPGDPGTPSVCSAPTLQPGQHTRTLTVDGQRRSYILHVPAGYSGERKVPLLLDFHALHTSADYQLNNSGTRAVADSQNFLVAYPQG